MKELPQKFSLPLKPKKKISTFRICFQKNVNYTNSVTNIGQNRAKNRARNRKTGKIGILQKIEEKSCFFIFSHFFSKNLLKYIFWPNFVMIYSLFVILQCFENSPILLRKSLIFSKFCYMTLENVQYLIKYDSNSHAVFFKSSLDKLSWK